ncbi:MAG TPA: hypothetical protein PLD20_14355 [Blastocatellia bacterium]|nr:hypothetical protein [Blastocatellia bacterium]HMX27163.1 hypothetical protein [Blastocatellia bacterium]HMZ19114.1 hypothetical protein [Blastocatellia bacterium]HNG34376.1 hypothetical protein [Blastocatellia bacterium]
MPTIEEFAGKNALTGKSISFETEGINYRLVRIDDRLYYRAHQQGVSIQEDYGFYLELWMQQRREGGALGLAETYTALTRLLGESSENYDPWKCSFSFPCLLEVKRESGAYGYALHIVDIKGSVNYRLYKLLDRDDKRFDRQVIQPPFAEEFSRAEINHFIAFMTGYLEGYFDAIKKLRHKWFFRKVQCEFILYGFQRGRFFNRRFSSESAFRKAVARAEARQKLAPTEATQPSPAL